MLTFGENIVEIVTADPEIIVLREIIKKAEDNKTRNAWQSLAYSPLGAAVSPLS